MICGDWGESKNVWILETKHPWARNRNLCTVESVARQMSDYCTRLLTWNYVPSNPQNYLGKRLEDEFGNVRLSGLPVESILESTPFIDFLNKTFENNTARHHHSFVHLSDALRLALVYKFGGIYIDSDIWAMKQIDLAPKYLARASGGMISNAVIKSEKPGSQILMKIMEEGNKAYDIHNYAVLMQQLCVKMAWYFKSKNHTIQLVDTRIGLIEDSGDWKIFGFKSGGLCSSYGKNQLKSPEEAEKKFEKLMAENCSMFHYMQSYLGQTQEYKPDDKSNLAVLVMAKTCPFTLSNADFV
ncbi:alpha-1,4-N-acetylglucosaminyltransferase-like [Symsagittifera roscoffensis]|uniref:alpha-1,4-N-acetylglucosaminyltransferase-like n=1 Tax=Symsagittifera roscoffensis TaxID=84072 RepID=UPI00307C6B4E